MGKIFQTIYMQFLKSIIFDILINLIVNMYQYIYRLEHKMSSLLFSKKIKDYIDISTKYPIKELFPRCWEALFCILLDENWNREYTKKDARYLSKYLFRGLADSSWELTTTIQRELETKEGPRYELEHNIFRNFLKYKKPADYVGETFWEKLSVAQHHGLPTRLLDWTLSPYVALHFVTCDMEHRDKDGVIWCVDYKEAMKDLSCILEGEKTELFTIDLMNKYFPNFNMLACIGGNIVFLEPPSIDDRIINQMAVCSVMSRAENKYEEFFKNHPTTAFKIIISKDLKASIRDRLDVINISERTLFPSLDGISAWLKRGYSRSNKLINNQSQLLLFR